MKFKKGDKVRIIAPKVRSRMCKDSTSNFKNLWMDDMDAWVGEEMTLNDFSPDGGWELIGWTFLEDWLELVSTSKDSAKAYKHAMGVVK